MSDQTINPPAEHASDTGNSQQPGSDWKARYDGANRKIQELVEAQKSKDEQLARYLSEVEQLKSQLSLKDIEKSAALSEREKRLQETIQAKTEADIELKKLKSMVAKVEAIKALNRPELLKVMDKIPEIEDPEALKGLFSDLASFADDAAAAREKQLLAGVTPVDAGARSSTQPSSEKAWMEHIDSLPLGSKERQKAFDEYWVWLNEANK